MRAVSAPALSRLTGPLADLRLPGPLLRMLVRAYIRAYGVDMSEAAEPLSAYPSFNAFFTRRLREGARPISADEGVVVSPCDSRVHSIGAVPESGLLEQIKGRTYALAALLASEEDARTFARGVHATLYLSPSMYHRVHSPVDGVIRAWRYVPGRLFPVNALAVRHVEALFAVNERVSILIDTPEFGAVAVIMVGATNVGRMTPRASPTSSRTRAAPARWWCRPRPSRSRAARSWARSTWAPPSCSWSRIRGWQPAGVAPGQIVRMGQPLWRRP